MDNIKVGVEGRDRSVHAAAPSLGSLTLRFAVSNARACAKEIEVKGGVIQPLPQTVNIQPYVTWGRVTKLSYLAKG